MSNSDQDQSNIKANFDQDAQENNNRVEGQKSLGAKDRVSSLSPEKQALLAKLLKEKRAQSARQSVIAKRSDPSIFPLSHAQRRMWFLSQWEPDSPFYNIASIVRMEGNLNIEALQRSFNEIFRRHEILRAHYTTTGGQPVQVIESDLELDLPLTDLSGLSKVEKDIQYQEIAWQEANKPFDISKAPLMRARLVKLQPEEHILFLSFHHIVSDGWSIGVFIREAALLYDAYSQGKPSPLQELVIQYADFAAWQNEWLEGETLTNQLEYWKEKLGGQDVYLELPTDRPRPTFQTYNGAYYKFSIPKDESQKLKEIALGEEATPFMALLAVFQLLLHRYSQQEDIRVGTPIAGRNRAELEALVGLFVNTLVMRADFSKELTFRELLRQVREAAIGAYAHQDLPLEMLLEELHVTRDMSRTPLYQVMFTLQEAPLKTLNIPSGRLTILEPDFGTAKFDLTLFMEESPEGLVGTFEYNTDLFNQNTIEWMAQSLRSLLSAIVRKPDQLVSRLPLLSQQERERILFEWNDRFSDYPYDRTLVELFEEQVDRSPDAIALIFPKSFTQPTQDAEGSFEFEQLTYREMNEKVNQLARFLRRQGVGQEDLVGLYLERSLEMVVATLAIIKAGGAYLPLDLSYPIERLKFILADGNVKTLLTNSALIENLSGLKDFSKPDQEKFADGSENIDISEIKILCIDEESIKGQLEEELKENLERVGTAESLAYVMYTSGSTGKPKGVEIQHRAITRLLFNTNYVDIRKEDRIAHASNPSFDAATFEIWGAFLFGAQLIGVLRDTALSSRAYASYLQEMKISVIFITTALFNHIANEVPDAFKTLRQLMFGGEQVDVKSVRRVVMNGKPERLINVYGPTESTTFASWYLIEDVAEDARNLPIGQPLSNTQLYVLDSHLEPVPVGIPGELYIGGDGLARGYLRRPDLTNEKFIENLFFDEFNAWVNKHHHSLQTNASRSSNQVNAGKIHDRRLYKTGDRVRLVSNENGEILGIEFLGRFDFQVKLRGLRIELGEIEAYLGQYPAIQQNVVILREDQPGDKRLVAYLVPHQDRMIDVNEVRRYLKDKLPEFMLPSSFVILDKMPINLNGKIDRKALPVPDQSRPDLDKVFIAPKTAVERYLASLWQEVLGVDQIGIYDDFFELGGDSLKAAVLMNRLQEELGGSTHVRALFMAPTIADLAMYMTEYYPQAVEKIQRTSGEWMVSSEITTAQAGESANVQSVQIPGQEISQTGLPRGGRVLELEPEGETQIRIDQEKIDLIRQIIKPLQPQAKLKSFHKNPPAVFVLSPPRSGSTLLRTMLAGNPQLFSPPELDLLSFNTLKERREAFSGDYSFWLEGVERAIMELKGCNAETARRIMQDFEDQDLTTQQFYGILQQWIQEMSQVTRMLVDKTPVYSLDIEILKQAEEGFEQPFYIHLVRHPFASIYSFIEAKLDGVFFRHKHPFTQRELAELVWIVSHQNIINFLSTIPSERQMRISFEEMVNNPSQVMESICNLLKIEFRPEMLKPYEGDRMTSGVRPGAQMVGDFKFYLRKDIDPKAADRWKKFHVQDFLSSQGWEIAEMLGYQKPEPTQRETSVLDELPSITPIPRDQDQTVLPLSYAQQRLWFLDQWEPGSPYYNVPAAVRMKGRINLTAMQRTLDEIIRRHEVLRTSFRSIDGKPVPIIDPQVSIPLNLMYLYKGNRYDRSQIDGSGNATLDQADLEAQAEQLAIEEARRPFDLTRGPLIRASVFFIDPEDCLVVLTMHHIISDGWSAGVLIREIAALYSAFSGGKNSPLPELSIQYVDYASWQRKWLQGEALEGQLNYWKNKLKNIPGLLELPTDRPRPAVQTLRGSRQIFEIPDEVFQQLKALSQQEEATLFMTLLAAFQVLLYRYSGQEDICVGTPIANRNRKEIEDLIGFFVNTLVLRSDLSGQPSFRKLVEQVKQVAVEAYDHQDLPFERLVDELQPERNQSHTPLFQVMFTLQDSSIQSLKLPGLTLIPFQLDSGTSKFDLILTMVDRGDVLKGVLEYNTDLFDPGTINRMVGHYSNLLHEIINYPDLPISLLQFMSNEELRQILYDWNATYEHETEWIFSQSIDQLFEKQVKRAPDNVAVIYGDESLTYQELDNRANQLARYLQSLGVGPEIIVALLVERSLEMMVGILGILKAGGAYLPLDPEYPQDRQKFILEDARTPVLLTQAELVERLDLKNQLSDNRFNLGLDQEIQVVCLDEDWHKISASLPDPRSNSRLISPGKNADEGGINRPNQAAYVIYTSGSTGRPKGVVIQHRSAINLWTGLNQEIYSQLPDIPLRVSLNAPLPFDASVQQWLMLLSGHSLVIIPADIRKDGAKLLKFIQDMRIDVLDCVPSQLKLLIEAGFFEDGGPIWYPKAILPGGEAIDEKTWEMLGDARKIEFFNMYGPTECTVDSTICQVSKHPLLPSIGRPINNAQTFILDSNFQPVPIGVPGELFIGGEGVGRGYLYREELTQERFIANPLMDYFDRVHTSNPFSTFKISERLYRTGDLVRYFPDGFIEYKGRIDFQVKLRGFRIELGEIDSVLAQAPGVKEAVVIVREDTPGEKQLVGYIVPTQVRDETLMMSEEALKPENESSTNEVEDLVNVSRLRNFLKERLPEYMVPGIFVFLDQMPLTPNRKIDRNALPRPEGVRPELEVVYEAPRNKVEQLLTNIWAQVLGLDKVGVHDNFFDLGGDSILSIQVVARANQAGLRLSPRNIFEAQTIEALADLVESSGLKKTDGMGLESIAEQGIVTGEVALTPIQHWFFEQQSIGNIANPDHWNQAILLEIRRPLQVDAMRDALKQLLRHHDALRMVFTRDKEGWKQFNSSWMDHLDGNSGHFYQDLFEKVDLIGLPSEMQREKIFQQAVKTQSSLNISGGQLIKVVYFDLGFGVPGRLLIVIHHLVIDGISWRLLLEDLLSAYQQASQGIAVEFPLKTTAFKQWSAKLLEAVEANDGQQIFGRETADELAYWIETLEQANQNGYHNLPLEYPDGENLEHSSEGVRFSLDEEETNALLRDVPAAYNTEIIDVLLTALALVITRWTKKNGIQISLEGHGREDILQGVDISRTVGWFTSLYPVNLTLDYVNGDGELGGAIITIKEQLRRVPRKGIGFGILRYLFPKSNLDALPGYITAKIHQLASSPIGNMSFNYLGQVDQTLPEGAIFGPASESSGPSHDPTAKRSYTFDVVASIAQNRLRVEWIYSKNQYSRQSLENLVNAYKETLREIITHCKSLEVVGYSPSDFPDVELSQDELEGLIEELGIGASNSESGE